MIAADELRALCQRIIQSGELGRSKTYAAILEYLAEQAITGKSPKEISIAMEVLGRGSDFDVGKDSIVRVHIYHLRNKLNAYYAKQGKSEKYRVDIPKGQYMLVTSLNAEQAEGAGPGQGNTGNPLQRSSLTSWLVAVAIILLVTNLYVEWSAGGGNAETANPYTETALWQPVFDDEMPILVLVGDYYIMGETDESGIVTRMVREFGINSRQDLDAARQKGLHDGYMNLDLSYIPTSVSNALVQVMQVLGEDNDRVSVKLMSEFTTADLVGSHIIYLGYLSGMQSLLDLMFAASGLAPGYTFDELYLLDEDSVFTSSSGLSTGDASYRDYGMLSTFPSPNGAQYLFLAGMRDEGLINLTAEVSMLPALHALERETLHNAAGDLAFEALYEVLGFSNTNIDASLVYSNPLDTKVLWETRLVQ